MPMNGIGWAACLGLSSYRLIRRQGGSVFRDGSKMVVAADYERFEMLEDIQKLPNGHDDDVQHV